MKINRRKFITLSSASGLAAGSTQAATDNHPQQPVTPRQTEGPFYPIVAQKDKDFDLTQIEGRDEKAKGRTIEIIGRVIDRDGKPVEDATVDLWQANAAGKYRHPHDPNPAPIDENFQGWAIVPSGKDGGFQFKTIYPGAYPASKKWTRPPHIHFKVSKRGYDELVTQMYFEGEELNQTDRLLQRMSADEQKRMIATTKKDQADQYHYTVVIEKVPDKE